MMIPKSQEANFLASLDSPPPWLLKLFQACAFLPAHVSSSFKADDVAASTSFCGEAIEREKVYNIVRDFCCCSFRSLPSDEEMNPLLSPSFTIFCPKSLHTSPILGILPV